MCKDFFKKNLNFPFTRLYQRKMRSRCQLLLKPKSFGAQRLRTEQIGGVSPRARLRARI